MSMHKLYLGLGANIGDCRRTISEANDEIGEQIGSVLCRSALYDTEPWGFESANRFVNAVVCCDTVMSPREVLDRTRRIERRLGRREKTVAGRYHDRAIDIDILLYDDITVDEPDLKIPHPLMQERDFVMIPLREIMGEETPVTPEQRL